MGNSIAHVCGHLHTLGDFVPKMYGKHPSGHLELELGDFTGSKRYDLVLFVPALHAWYLQSAVGFDYWHSITTYFRLWTQLWEYGH